MREFFLLEPNWTYKCRVGFQNVIPSRGGDGVMGAELYLSFSLGVKMQRNRRVVISSPQLLPGGINSRVLVRVNTEVIPIIRS